MGAQELLQAASGGTGVAQVLARAVLAAGGDLSGVSSDGRPMALMPDVKVCCCSSASRLSHMPDVKVLRCFCCAC